MSHAQALSGAPTSSRSLHGRRGPGLPRGAVRSAIAVLVFLGMAAAAGLQIRLDRTEGLAQASRVGRSRAMEAATQIGDALDRYSSIGAAFASARSSAETSAALARTAGPALRDVAIVGPHGELVSEMRGAPGTLLPVPSFVLAKARRARTVLRRPGSLALLFPYGAAAIIRVEIDPDRLPPSDAQAKLFLAGPNVSLPESQFVARVPGWPLLVGAGAPAPEGSGTGNSLGLHLGFMLSALIGGATLALLLLPDPSGSRRSALRRESVRAYYHHERKLLVRLAHAERRGAQAESAKSRFIAHLNHELRTPLNAIIGFAEAIETGVFGLPGHPKYGEYARDIALAGRELHAKIGMVLEFSALGKNADGPAPNNDAPVCDAAETARAQIARCESAARERGLRLEASLPDSAPARADRGILERVLAHLMDNAIAYTSRGGCVRIDVRAGAREIAVILHDTGEGFTRSERDLAGLPFQRFARTHARPGLGLGLSIAMGLTRHIGGTLAIASIPGEGTRAELRLPAC